MAVNRILVLGGYGNFGKRIVESLSSLQGVTLLVGGRSLARAEALCNRLDAGGVRSSLKPVEIDIKSSAFVAGLDGLSPDLVIHTGGPFQGQDYTVPRACIDVGCHYIDLADDRRFVCDINSLHQRALEKGVLIVSGASSVPGLSSTVIDELSQQFSFLEKIDFAIAPGNRAERGAATVRGILSYTGHAFPVFINGRWQEVYGWMSARRLNFGSVIGKRWLANVDIPDLELFPERYKPVKTVLFQAGLELPILHWGMVFMAALAKVGLIRDWSNWTAPIVTASEWFRGFGTDIGGMQINLLGTDSNQQRKSIKWTLTAEHGIGPYIPTLSAIILSKKFIAGTIDKCGAFPCLGLYSLDEFDQEALGLGIRHQTETSVG